MSRAFAALRALLYGAVFLGFWAWVALQCRALDPVLGLGLPPGVRGAGWALMGIGALIAFVCAASFVVEGEGTPAPFDAPRKFVASGPYRWVRNPMYIGGVLLLAGFGLFHRSGAMVAFAGLWGGMAHLFVVLYEEPHLEEKFGDRYRSYLREVNRWIPRAPEPGD